MAIVTTPLGFQKPDGLDPVRNGDNVIAANGAKAEELHQDARGRLTVIESKNATQDTDIAAARTNAVADAKTYTDAQDLAYRTTDRALWRAEDDSHQAAAETNAAAYTDSADTANRAAWAAADTTKLAEAKAYADAGLALDRTRLTNVEAKQAVKAVRLEAGNWVWDTAAGTHYVIPDHDGSLIVRATAQPVPAATPTLNW